MKNEHQLKIEAIRKHFYSTKMQLGAFHEEFYESYGYYNAVGLKKLCITNGITVTERSKLNATSKGIKTEFNLDLIDNFGIEISLGREYTSQQLPSELKKIGVLSDIHFPYHNLEALRVAIAYLREQEIDCLYLNGDIFDFYSISRHEKDPDMQDFPREIGRAHV